MLKRFRSPVLWLAIAALIAFVTKNWMGFEIPEWNTFVELLLGVLVAFGIVNNPNDKEHF